MARVILTDYTTDGPNISMPSRTNAATKSYAASILSIQTLGYLTPGDGGGAIYKRVASQPAHTGKFQSADGGWWELSEAQDIFVEMFGARAGTSTTQSTIINAAIAYAKAKGGMPLNFGLGTFAIGETISVTSNNIKLIGQGAGDFHYTSTPTDYSTALRWIGSAGGVMVRYSPTNNSGMWLSGAALKGIYLDTNSTAGTSVEVRSSFGGSYEVVTRNYTSQAFLLNIEMAVEETRDSMHNEIWIRGSSSTGSLLNMGGIPTANSCFNRISVDGNYKDGHGIQVYNADNNLFFHVRMYREDGGTGVGVVLNGGAVNEEARGNIFIDLSPGAGGVHSTGTDVAVSAAKENQCLFYDSPNFAPDPTYGTGATFWYSRNDNKQPHVRGRIGNVTSNSATPVTIPLLTPYEDMLSMRSGNQINIPKPGVYRLDYTIHHNATVASGDKYLIKVYGFTGGVHQHVVGMFGAVESSIQGSVSGYADTTNPVYLTIERASGTGSFVTGADSSLSTVTLDYVSRSL